MYSRLVERKPRPRLALLGAGRHHAIVKSGNANVPFAILQRRQNFRDGLQRIRRGAAIDARVQIVIRAFHHQLAIDDAAQTDADGGQLRREHLGIANHRGVAFQARGLAGDVGFDVLAAHFFFALDQELHVDRQPPVLLQQAFHGFDQDVGLPFVVGRSARIDVVVANVGLKRRRLPFVQRIGRLHIVMPVEQHGRLARRAQPFGVHQRIAFAFDQLRLLQARRAPTRRARIRPRAGCPACARTAC